TAGVGLVLPQPLAVVGGLLAYRARGLYAPNLQAVALLEALPEQVGLWEEQAGVEGEDVDGEPVAGDQVDQHASLDAETGGEGQAGKALRGPAQDLRGRPPF